MCQHQLFKESQKKNNGYRLGKISNTHSNTRAGKAGTTFDGMLNVSGIIDKECKFKI